MWPFKKKTGEDESELLVPLSPVVLTAEEKEEIDRDLKVLFGSNEGAYYAEPEVADVARRAIAAQALSYRAKRLMSLGRSQTSLEESSELTEKACASAAKAWRIFPEEPLYLYWFGRLLGQADKPDEAIAIFRRYLRQQEAVPPLAAKVASSSPKQRNMQAVQLREAGRNLKCRSRCLRTTCPTRKRGTA